MRRKKFNFFAALALCLFVTAAQQEQSTSSLSLIYQQRAPIPSRLLAPENDSLSPDIRACQSALFDRRGQDKLLALPDGVNPLPLTSFLKPHSVPIPIDGSTVIVVGSILSGQTHLSSDGTGLYTEYGVFIHEVLQEGPVSPTQLDQIRVLREGGALQLEDRVVTYLLPRAGLPLIGSEYILFLRFDKNCGHFQLETGYLVDRDEVFPLDDLRWNREANLPHAEEPLDGFLDLVRERIAKRKVAQ